MIPGERAIPAILNFHETPRMSRVIINPYRFASPYLVAEDCEGSGTPAGWTFDSVGTADWDNTGSTSPQGGQCLALASNTNNAAGGARFALPASQAELWLYFEVQHNALNQNRSIYLLDTGTGSTGIQLDFRIASSALVRNFINLATAGALLTHATWAHLWLHLSPTTLDLWVAATDTRPGSPSMSYSGTVAAITNIGFGMNGSGGIRVDKIRVATSEIGSAPP